MSILLKNKKKICLHGREEGVKKSPKLCLRNIWMVPGDHLNSFWPAMRAQVTSKDTYFLHIAYCYQVHNMSKLLWSLITNHIHIVPYVRQWGQIHYEVGLHLNLWKFMQNLLDLQGSVLHIAYCYQVHNASISFWSHIFTCNFMEL